MRYFILFLCSIICIISLNFFIDTSEDVERKLIISPYVFEEGVTDPNEWDDNTQFSFEPLELNEARLMAPTSGAGMWNLNILFEYEDGVIEVTSEDVQISVGANARPFYDTEEGHKGRSYGYSKYINDSGYMAFYPTGGCYGYHEIDDIKIPSLSSQEAGYPGKEYDITVKVYKNPGDEWPIVTATLKLVQLEDKKLWGGTSEQSRYYSIELTSYE
ncbi:MAG: hypothetical protein IJ493_00905 [Clostridia bacterium]|nr:hypothetical protein [Clostridia bacterium]